ncbi:unnamed protein product [Staurois parvus]|uniref:Uncharacterized protein n=1 Tax=Staurois parvus TaxID=386267 RepID=A0ABN9AXB0_9NEOB|nr:unnamed protein product [Staurois parvus]
MIDGTDWHHCWALTGGTDWHNTALGQLTGSTAGLPLVGCPLVGSTGGWAQVGGTGGHRVGGTRGLGTCWAR